MPATGSSGKLPIFVTYTGRERDEFLRGAGVTEYDDINLFNLLCSYATKRGSAKIPVAEFLGAVAAWARNNRKPNLMGGAAKTAFRRLVTSLERNGYASTKDDLAILVLREGQRRSGQGERAVIDIEKAYRRMETDPTALFPGTADIVIPPTALVPVSYTELTRELIRGQTESTKILRVTFGEDVDLLAIPAVVGNLMEIARRRVHFYIQNNPGLYNYVLSEIRKIPQFRHVMDQSRLYAFLEHRAETPPLFWVYLGLAVVRSRNEDIIEPKFRAGRMSLYQSAYLLHGYWQNEHRVEQERKQRAADEKALEGWMERSGRGYTLEEMGDIHDDAGKPLKDKYKDIRAFLVEVLDKIQAEAAATNQIPRVLLFGELWMHQHTILPRFEDEVRAASEYCRRAMELDIKAKLDKGAVDDAVLFGDAGFVQALNTIVETRCQRLAAMMKKPQLIHGLITELATENPGLFRTHSTLFEALDRPVFKRMDHLLGLSREDMISHIVSGMSLIRRFLLRRRFRIRKPDGRPTRPRAAASAAAKADSEALDRNVGTEGATTKTTKSGQKPTVIRVERGRKKGPKTMDEAMVKLREAMSKRGPPG